ncbi:MAG: biotin--[acetyl-CoA-carboxylase] ligase [Cryomorphaceae bacterium]|nr:biotin--[acetyl-CoA-carboxylase] ligase [Flavobacteriales bacterium]
MRLTVLEETDSTNNYVAKALKEGCFEAGTAIMSRFQTQGRGQRGSIWQSRPGENLTFSFAVDVDFLPIHRSFLLSKAVSLGLCEAVASMTGVESKVKWPNDILAGKAKIAGILIETKVLGSRYAVIGIGLNVNQTEFDPDFRATSLALELDRNVEVEKAAAVVISHLNPRLDMLRKGAFEQINDDYNKVLHGYRSPVEFQTSERSFEGMITEVDEQGMLLVKSRQGHAGVYAPKQIQIRY